MQIEITPFDTLFFRDGKPFSMGDEVWASGLFPPPPSVLYGALRTSYFASLPDQIGLAAGFFASDEQKGQDPTRKLQITGFALKHGEDDRYFPVPADLIRTKEKPRPVLLSRTPNPINSSGKLREILGTSELSEAYPTGSMISFGNMRDYLAERPVNQFTILPPSFFRISESKTGIARSSTTGSAKEGHLYRVEMARMEKKVSFLCEYKNLELDTNLIKLGGEAKAVSIQNSERNILPTAGGMKNNLFKLYLSTPAIFSQGWLPSWINPETMEGTLPQSQVHVKLIAAAIGKATNLGGFDMQKRKFKPMKRAVPAGSTYYFESLQGENPSYIHGKSISDYLPEQGFGIAFLGTV